MKEEALIARFKDYVAHKFPAASDIDIGLFRMIVGGASRQTFRLELNYTLHGERLSRRLILRREFDSGIIDTRTRTEWEAYRAFYGTGVPVPELLWLEEDPRWLETAFMVIEEIVGCQDALDLFSQPPFAAVREKVGETFCRIMGTIAVTDPAAVGLEGKLARPAADTCWKKELDYWVADIDKNEQEPNPILRAAIRWLRRHPPPPAQKVAIVHGDMRSGNFLFTEDGEIRAVLDWEMMHMGDPLEDLAWALNRLWTWYEPDRLGLMLPRDDAVRIWEETSGFRAAPQDLFWWEVFTSVKAMAIWISMNRVYATGENAEVIICYGGMWALDMQRRILIEQLKEVV